MFFKSWQKGMKEENANWSSMVYRQKAMILCRLPQIFQVSFNIYWIIFCLGKKKNLNTFSLKDSILVESSSQSASSQSSRQEELNHATVLDIFDDTQVYRFYSEGKFSIGGFF